jgi:hypothetical protein
MEEPTIQKCVTRGLIICKIYTLTVTISIIKSSKMKLARHATLTRLMLNSYTPTILVEILGR